MTATLAALLLMMAVPAEAKRVALLIGNNDYRHIPKLQKAVNDARTMGDTLKQLGFNVMVAENQTRQGFSQSLLSFDAALDPGKRLLSAEAARLTHAERLLERAGEAEGAILADDARLIVSVPAHPSLYSQHDADADREQWLRSSESGCPGL